MTMWLITVKPSYDFGIRIVIPLVQKCYNSLEEQSPLKGNTVGSRVDVRKSIGIDPVTTDPKGETSRLCK